MDKTEAYYRIMYSSAVYNGIKGKIKVAMYLKDEDRRKELRYMVDRYCNEECISDVYLREELEKYNKLAEERFGKLEK